MSIINKIDLCFSFSWYISEIKSWEIPLKKTYRNTEISLNPVTLRDWEFFNEQMLWWTWKLGQGVGGKDHRLWNLTNVSGARTSVREVRGWRYNFTEVPGVRLGQGWHLQENLASILLLWWPIGLSLMQPLGHESRYQPCSHYSHNLRWVTSAL